MRKFNGFCVLLSEMLPSSGKVCNHIHHPHNLVINFIFFFQVMIVNIEFIKQMTTKKKRVRNSYLSYLFEKLIENSSTHHPL